MSESADDRDAKDDAAPRRAPNLEDFLVEPTRDLAAWQWLWRGNHEFPIRSHRGALGWLLVLFKRLFRPLVKTPQNELWDRQRVFNVILLEHLLREAERADRHHDRIAYLEALDAEGITELMRHTDALYARVDQKLDFYRRETRDLLGGLGAALAAVEQQSAGDGRAPAATAAGGEALAGAPLAGVARAREEQTYFELECRYRGAEEDIAGRISHYLPWLTGKGKVLDLGCGRGEALALLAERGIPGIGVDSSARMVALCRERGLDVAEGDLLERLAAEPAESLGGVVSFHVIEHLPPEVVDRLVRLAYRALAPGGVLVLETPNPLSVVVAARNFWLDPTHRRPVHPETLRFLYDLAGFRPIERVDLRPFAEAERLPEIDLAALPAEQHALADRVNRLRDRLDEVLFGYQDYGLVGTKPASG